MLEIIELKISSPRVELPGLQDSITGLRTLAELHERVSKLGPLKLTGLTESGAALRGMTDTAKIMVDNLERAGQTSAAGAFRQGAFRSSAEEMERLNVAAGNLQILLRKMPPVGSQIYTGNPAIANQVDAVQTALASVNLRRREIKGAVTDVSVQAQFDREAAALATAEKGVTAASSAAAQALGEQGSVVTRKTGQMGELTRATDAAAGAERNLSGSSREAALLQERFRTTAKGTEQTLQQFRTGVGETQSVLGKGGGVVVDQINHLEKYRDALRANTAEFANRRVTVRRGSAEEVQLFRDEAAEIEKITKRFGQFAGTAEQQRAEVRQAGLLRRAADSEARLGQAAAAQFQQRSALFAQPADTRRTTLPTGEVQERRTVTRDVGTMRESLSLMSRFDAQGKLLNATLEETNRHVDRVGKTTQGTLLGTIGMAAKFIGVYRGIDLGIQAFEAGSAAAVEFERKLATLTIIFRGTREEAGQLALEALKVASSFGQDGVAAVQVAVDFARFGGTMEQVLETVRVVALAANVAQISLEEASKNFQAIMSSFSLDPGQLGGVLGMLNTVSNTWNVTVKQLLDGLARVGPLARQAGLEVNEIIALEAIITGRTGRPGAEAGNAIKALLSRLTKKDVQESLQDTAGISVKDQSGQLKTASQLLNELFIAYQNLGRAEQQELLIKVAGTHQAARIAALLDGYIKSQELAVRASLDLASSERENIAVRKTLSSQLGTLTTEWQRFWVAGAGAGEAGGVQTAITEGLIHPLSNVLSLLTGSVTLMGKLSKFAIPKTGNAGLDRTFDEAGKLGFGLLNPLYGIGHTMDLQKEALNRAGLGDIFKSDAEKAADALNKFNGELDTFERRAQGFAAASRQIRTVAKLIDTAPVEKRAEYLQAAARGAAPTDARRQQVIFEELTNLAKANDFIALHARLSELDKEKQNERSEAIGRSNKMLDAQIGTIGRDVESLEARRTAAARRNDQTAVADLDKQIEQRKNQLLQLNQRRAGIFQESFPEGEEAYGLDTTAERKKQLERLQAHLEGIQQVFKAYPITAPPDFFHVGALDRQLDEIKEKLREVDRLRLDQVQKAQKNYLDAVGGVVVPNADGSVSTVRSMSINEKGKEVLIPTTAADGSRVLSDQEAIDQYHKTGRNLGVFDTPEEATAHAEELHKLHERAGEVQENAIRRAKEEAAVARETLETERQKVEALRGYAALQDAIARGARQGRIAPEQFKVGRDETEQLIAEARGIMEQLLPRAVSRAENARTVGDNETAANAQAEALQLTNQLGDIQLRLDERRYKIAADIANARQKEAEEAGKALVTATREEQLRAVLAQRFIEQRGGRGFSANEFSFLDRGSQQSLERFLPGSLPEQLRSLSGLNRELARNRERDTSDFRAPGIQPRVPRDRDRREPHEPRTLRDGPDRRRFRSEREPQERDRRSRAPDHLDDLERERTILIQQFQGLNSAIEETRKFIDQTIGRNLITNPAPTGPGAMAVPGAMPLPAVNIDVASQFAELTKYLGDTVISRFDTELAAIRQEFRDFVGNQRLNSAQAAASGAI